MMNMNNMGSDPTLESTEPKKSININVRREIVNTRETAQGLMQMYKQANNFEMMNMMQENRIDK